MPLNGDLPAFDRNGSGTPKSKPVKFTELQPGDAQRPNPTSQHFSSYATTYRPKDVSPQKPVFQTPRAPPPPRTPLQASSKVIDLTSESDDELGNGAPTTPSKVEAAEKLQFERLKRPLSALDPEPKAIAHKAENLSAFRRYGLRDTLPQPSYRRGRGRPRLYARIDPTQKRPRGRPRKDALAKNSIAKVAKKEQLPKKPISRKSPPSTASSTPPRDWRVPGKLDGNATYEWMERHINHQFVQQLMPRSPATTIVNTVDEDNPPSDFTIIDSYEFTRGTYPLDPNARYGCSCDEENGKNAGCEYGSCDCLADCNVDEDGNDLGFPYEPVSGKTYRLRQQYLDRREVIYECNELCGCGESCKNKVVGRGRRANLEIFKTEGRGWGLRCWDNLYRGQFVEVYLGEIITDAEARRREAISSVRKDSYLFSLDKFSRETGSDDASYVYVVDGEKQGSVARFINHCCDPNLLVYAVSRDRGDPRVYQLAFFAAEDITAGTELTFDYLDRDEVDEEDKILASQQEGGEKAECRCGAPNCRKWLWI